MKTSTYISTLIVAALLTTGGAISVAAQEAGSREDRRAEMFADLDADGNGVVSAEEFAAGVGLFGRADADGNGLLTAEEIAASNQDRAERRAARMIERLDTNSDGMLSQEEVTARRSPAQMFDRLDANDDGEVSAEEFADARMDRRGGKHHGWGHGKGGGKRHGNR
ncbi:EF-hand domain-containing protein [Marivita sp. S0852]|uniref:EF-hand domain-containing protein n=1 Tax=Marivita sp. S0852 TaxID=3373893 RepID=UPI003982B2E3